MGLVPFVAIVLEGDWTAKLKEKDEIETNLVKYRIDSLGFDLKTNMTSVLVKEISP